MTAKTRNTRKPAQATKCAVRGNMLAEAYEDCGEDDDDDVLKGLGTYQQGRLARDNSIVEILSYFWTDRGRKMKLCYE